MTDGNCWFNSLKTFLDLFFNGASRKSNPKVSVSAGDNPSTFICSTSLETHVHCASVSVRDND